MSPQIVTLLITAVMIGLSFAPLYFGAFYLLFRPLVQPYANLHYTILPGVPLTGVFAVFLVAYAGANCIIRRHHTLLAPNVLPLYLLLFFSATSFLNTMSHAVSIAHVFKIGTGVSLYLLIYNSIQTESDAKKILYALVITTIIPMLYGYYQFLTDTGGRGLMGMSNRINSFLGMANAYGELLCIALCALVSLLLWEKGTGRRIFLLSVLCSVVASLVLSLNRGSWLAVTSGLLFAYIPHRRRLKVRWFILAALVIAVVFSDIIVQRFLELQETTWWGGTRNTLHSRMSLWKMLVHLLDDHPFLGFGIGTTSLVTMKFFRVDAVPHNDYLRLTLEVGFPGVLLYIAYLARELLYNIKVRFNEKAWFVNYPMLACLTYWIILSGVQNLIYSVTIFPMFMTLVGVARKFNALTSEKETPQGKVD